MKVLYDSNVLIRYLAGDDSAKPLVEKVVDGTWEGYITDTVASEVIYIYLRLALGVTRYRLRELVASRDRRVKTLLEEDVKPLLSLFNLLPSGASLEELLTLIENYGLLPNDALIAATALANNIDAVATFDNDFEKMPWIRIVR